DLPQKSALTHVVFTACNQQPVNSAVLAGRVEGLEGADRAGGGRGRGRRRGAAGAGGSRGGSGAWTRTRTTRVKVWRAANYPTPDRRLGSRPDGSSHQDTDPAIAKPLSTCGRAYLRTDVPRAGGDKTCHRRPGVGPQLSARALATCQN